MQILSAEDHALIEKSAKNLLSRLSKEKNYDGWRDTLNEYIRAREWELVLDGLANLLHQGVILSDAKTFNEIRMLGLKLGPINKEFSSLADIVRQPSRK